MLLDLFRTGLHDIVRFVLDPELPQLLKVGEQALEIRHHELYQRQFPKVDLLVAPDFLKERE